MMKEVKELEFFNKILKTKITEILESFSRHGASSGDYIIYDSFEKVADKIVFEVNNLLNKSLEK